MDLCITPGADKLFRLALVGPGDRFHVATHVQVRRITEGQWELRANVPCVLELPGQPGTWTVTVPQGPARTVAAQVAKRSDHVIVTLTEADLADGVVVLKAP